MDREERFPRMHVSMYVRDLEETVKFYDNFFGTEPTKVKPNYAKYELTEPGLIISFVQNEERAGADMGHMGIQVSSKEEVLKRMAVLGEKGMQVREEIGTNCCYAEQDKFWVTDPDGIQWEIYYFHKDVEWNDPKYAGDAGCACVSPSTDNESKTQKMNQSEVDEACCEPGSGCC